MRKKKLDSAAAEAELIKARRLLRAEKKKAKKLKGSKLERANKKRAIETLEAGVEATEKLRDAAEELDIPDRPPR
jgi:hypothetical protein